MRWGQGLKGALVAVRGGCPTGVSHKVMPGEQHKPPPIKPTKLTLQLSPKYRHTCTTGVP